MVGTLSGFSVFCSVDTSEETTVDGDPCTEGEMSGELWVVATSVTVLAVPAAVVNSKEVVGDSSVVVTFVACGLVEDDVTEMTVVSGAGIPPIEVFTGAMVSVFSTAATGEAGVVCLEQPPE